MFYKLSQAKVLLRWSHVTHPGKVQCELWIDCLPVLVCLPISMLSSHPANVSSDSVIEGNQFNLYAPLLFMLTDSSVLSADGPICLLLSDVDLLHVLEVVLLHDWKCINRCQFLQSHELGYTLRGKFFFSQFCAPGIILSELKLKNSCLIREQSIACCGEA